jgi:hypothetical protein
VKPHKEKEHPWTLYGSLGGRQRKKEGESIKDLAKFKHLVRVVEPRVGMESCCKTGGVGGQRVRESKGRR